MNPKALAKNFPVAVIIMMALALRFAYLGQMPLLPDEAYYWLWSRQLDWAYYDHPAGTAILLRLSTVLGGNDEFGIRWLNALLATACVALAISLTQRIYSQKAGLLVGALMAFGAPFLITSRFVYTDTLFLFLLLLNFHSITCLNNPFPRKSEPSGGSFAKLCPFVWFGLSLALLLNTKYTAYLYALGLGVWIVWKHRPLMRDPRFWLAVGIAMLGLIPVLGWNLANDWASLRWQLSHGTSLSPGASLSSGILKQWVANGFHAGAYLTWPLAVIALAGLWPLRRIESQRELHWDNMDSLVWISSIFMFIPIFLSPASSPRNLIPGLLLLLLRAAGHAIDRELWVKKGKTLIFFVFFITALYGFGTVSAIKGFSNPFSSSAASQIRRDVARVEELKKIADFSPPQNILFSIDYTLAAQLHYYTRRPAYTSWGQYKIWGYPMFDNVTLLSFEYLPEKVIDKKLREAFTYVQGPYQLKPGSGEKLPVIFWWEVEGLIWDQARFLETFDFLTLFKDYYEP